MLSNCSCKLIVWVEIMIGLRFGFFWEKLAEGGDRNAQQCGWLKDRFGVSWQIVPSALVEMLNDPDSEKTQRVMNALLQMKKLGIGELSRAYTG